MENQTIYIYSHGASGIWRTKLYIYSHGASGIWRTKLYIYILVEVSYSNLPGLARVNDSVKVPSFGAEGAEKGWKMAQRLTVFGHERCFDQCIYCILWWLYMITYFLLASLFFILLILLLLLPLLWLSSSLSS